MIDKLKSQFGALRVDFRINEGKRYYIYGYEKDANEWDFEKGKLIGVTENASLIDILQDHLPIIKNEDVFCRSCFKKKKINIPGNLWHRSVYDWLPEEVYIKIQNEILYNFSDFNWNNIRNLPNNYKINYGLCLDCFPTETELRKSEFYNDYYNRISNIQYFSISEFITNNSNESILEKYLAENISLIEEGMKLIECQKNVDNGRIDIFAEDRNKNFCIIELKTNSNDKNIVWQAANYQSYFGSNTRVITIAPGYSPSIYNALKNVKNVEIKVYNLDDEGYLQIKGYDIEETVTSQTLVSY